MILLDEPGLVITGDENMGNGTLEMGLKLEIRNGLAHGRWYAERYGFIKKYEREPSGLTIGDVGSILLPFALRPDIMRTRLQETHVRAMWSKLELAAERARLVPVDVDGPGAGGDA
jgi:hypothetical protein